MRFTAGFGLRPKILAALLLTGAITLSVAAVVLLPRLEHRLTSDQLDSLAATARAAGPSVNELAPVDLQTSSPRMRAIVDGLERRTGARAVVMNRRGQVLGDSSPGDAPPPAGRAALTKDEIVRQVVTSSSGRVTEVAVPVGSRGDLVLTLVRPLAAVQRAVGVVERAFVVAAVAGLAVAAILGVGLSTTLSRRLRRLEVAVDRVGQEPLDSTMPVDERRDEVGALTRGFVEMQTRLRRQEDARRAFVANASHELRTPVASLQTTLELAEQDLEGPAPDVEEALNGITRARGQADRLAGIARDLLDLSRLDAGVEMRSEVVDVVEIARAIAAELADRARAMNTPITVAAADAHVLATADPSAVARIVHALLDNALAYARGAGPIDITSRRKGATVELAVVDAGPGVPEDDRESIFERFNRGHVHVGEPGSGLGLAIGRELARRMGGDLSIADIESGSGARFVLALPSAEAPTGPAAAGPVNDPRGPTRPSWRT